ncbi:MAG TPA: hypothetical protein V6C81_03925 [Planktothrix sp.]|jgi:Spy/CpxP family protein refolding chaperone
MKRANLGMLFCALVLASSCPLLALADDDKSAGDGASWGPGTHHSRGGGVRGDALVKQVLTADQTKQYESILADSKAARIKLAGQIKELNNKAASGKLSDDENKKLGDLEDQIKQIHKTTRTKINAMLSPDQQKQLKALVDKARQEKRTVPDEAKAAE